MQSPPSRLLVYQLRTSSLVYHIASPLSRISVVLLSRRPLVTHCFHVFSVYHVPASVPAHFHASLAAWLPVSCPIKPIIIVACARPFTVSPVYIELSLIHTLFPPASLLLPLSPQAIIASPAPLSASLSSRPLSTNLHLYHVLPTTTVPACKI